MAIKEMLKALHETRSREFYSVCGIVIAADVETALEAEVQLTEDPRARQLVPAGATGTFAGLPFVTDPDLPSGTVQVFTRREAWLKRLDDLSAKRPAPP